MSLHPAAPKWTHNNARIGCERCLRNFSFAIRRHHCRACGALVCTDCSGFSRILPQYGYGETPVRVCIQCNRKHNSQIEAELRAFVLANRVFQKIKSMPKIDELSEDLKKVSLYTFANALYRLREFSGVPADFLNFVEEIFEKFSALQLLELRNQTNELVYKAYTYLDEMEFSRKRSMSNLEEIGITCNDLLSLVKCRAAIEDAVLKQGSIKVSERIWALKPANYDSLMEKLEFMSSKVLQKETAPQLNNRLMGLCKTRVKEKKLQEQLDSLNPKERKRQESIETVHRVPTEAFLNIFVKALRDAHANPYVSAEIVELSHQFLAHIVVDSLKENYSVLLRSLDEPGVSALYTSLTQAYRLLSICEEFVDSIDVHPPSRYRSTLKDVCIIAKQKMKEFGQKERAKLLEMLGNWPVVPHRASSDEKRTLF